MRKERGFYGVMVVVLLVAVLLMSLAGCASPNRGQCKKSCEKLAACDAKLNGDDAEFGEDWLRICKDSCDAADDIDSSLAKCIVGTECDKLLSTCKIGS